MLRYGRPLFGPFRRTAHTGVPADHFLPVRGRRRMLEHDGRVTALVADGPAARERARDLVVERLTAFEIDTAKVAKLVAKIDEAVDDLMDELKIEDPDDDGDDGDMARLVDAVFAKVAAAAGVFKAMPVHHTEVDVDGAWDAGANTKRISNDAGKSTLRKMYAWVDPDGDADTKSAYAFPHHNVSGDGDVGAANLKACAAVVAALNGGRGADSSAAWWSDRSGIYAHVKAHYADGGVDDKDIPELDSMAVAVERAKAFARFSDMGVHPVEAIEKLADLAAVKLRTDTQAFASHDAFAGIHTHAHSTFASGDNGDAIHEHEHEHHGDSTHDHLHPADMENADEENLGNRRGRSASPRGGHALEGQPFARLGELDRRRVDGANEITDPNALAALVASALNARGVTAAADINGDVTPSRWHAYLCVEGVRTDDGRMLKEGCCRFPDLPVSLRLLVEDEGGHWGAVTCGRIDTMERQDKDGTSVIYAEGQFGSDPNGQLAELMVTEQTQRFVSIDPRDITATMVEVAIRRSQFGDVIVVEADDYDDDGVVYDCYWEFTDCVIGGATIVAMPALPQAVITLADVDLPWSQIAMDTAPPSVVTAAGGPVAPPAAWFDDPGFHVGDPRLVRQPDGKFACPLTVTDDGRVFGHFCYWGAKHTAFPGRTVNPPKSHSGYAHFLTGMVTCDDGSAVPVGQITMGTGHAPLTKRAPNGREVPLSSHEVAAHYDGGYGAVQMCDVAVGEDDFGAWFAGALRPGVTDEQVREFKALGLSGDWRTMAGHLDLLAILSVPAPGFPIARKALTAAGNEVDVTISSDLHVGVHDDNVFAMVAAGVVRRPDPERRLAVLESRMDEVLRLVRPLALERARALVALTE